MKRPTSTKVTLYRLLASLVVGLSVLGAAPLVVSAIAGAHVATTQLAWLSDWHRPALRSILFMATCGPACLVVGFILGSRLADLKIPVRAPAGILLVPILLGAGLNAFIFKLCLVDITFLSAVLRDRQPIAFWTAVYLMFLWQYVPAITFLVWLSCGQMSASIRDFGSVHRLGFYARAADLYWPRCRNLLLYLFILISAATAAEYEHLALVFRASSGTDSEMMSHWLLKTYFSLARVAPALATQTVLFFSTEFAATCVAVVGLMAVCARGVPSLLRAIEGRRQPRLSPRIQKFLVPVSAILILLPFIPTLIRGVPHLQAGGVASGYVSLLLPALGTATVCSAFAVVIRLAWHDTFGDFNVRGTALCLIVACAGFLPPVALAFSGMWWMTTVQKLGKVGPPPVVLCWWFLLGLGALPLFLPGYLTVQYSVPSEELRFQNTHRASFFETVRASFFQRLWPAYVLFGVFVFTHMIGEYPVTALFSGLSTTIQSPILGLAVRTEGKGAEFNEAAAIVLQMALGPLLSAISLGAWIGSRQRRTGGSI